MTLCAEHGGKFKTGLVRLLDTDSGHYLIPISSFLRDASHQREQRLLRERVTRHFAKITSSFGKPLQTAALREAVMFQNVDATLPSTTTLSAATPRAGGGTIFTSLVAETVSVAETLAVPRVRYVPEYYQPTTDRVAFMVTDHASTDVDYRHPWRTVGELKSSSRSVQIP